MNAFAPSVFALLMICLLPPTSATVVQDFNHVERCKDSLYMGTPPRGIVDSKLKKICQRYADKPRYVTLYDPQKRIPVYSAYTFKKTEGDRRVDYPWMYEPQVRGLSLSDRSSLFFKNDKNLLHKGFFHSFIFILNHCLTR